MINLDQQQTIEATLKWIRIIQKDQANPQVPTNIDARKSSLLARILSGKEPLPFPPPTAFSYPWYEIVESSEPLDNIDVWFYNYHAEDNAEGIPAVNVNQAQYQIVMNIAEKVYVIKDHRRDTPYRFLLWFDGLYPIMHRIKDKEEIRYGAWRMKNITPAELLNIQQ